MKPIDAVLSFNLKFAFSSVTLSKEKWLVNWFCFTISSKTSFCMAVPLTEIVFNLEPTIPSRSIGSICHVHKAPFARRSDAELAQVMVEVFVH